MKLLTPTPSKNSSKPRNSHRKKNRNRWHQLVHSAPNIVAWEIQFPDFNVFLFQFPNRVDCGRNPQRGQGQQTVLGSLQRNHTSPSMPLKVPRPFARPNFHSPSYLSPGKDKTRITMQRHANPPQLGALVLDRHFHQTCPSHGHCMPF